MISTNQRRTAMIEVNDGSVRRCLSRQFSKSIVDALIDLIFAGNAVREDAPKNNSK